MRNTQNMKKTKIFLLSVFLICVIAGDAGARDIYVRLADNQSSVAVRSDSDMTLTDAARNTLNLGRSATLTRSGSSAAVGNRRFQLPVRISTGGFLGFNNRRYRGEFLLTREFVLINAVNVEDYVQGVLPVEGIASWPMEYQRAQAIISRTYGLRQSLNRSARGYDVVDTTSDQVYRGAGVETAATNQAVRNTAGMVLAYGNTLAFTPFHSDSGGHTATNSHVWVSDIPYLTGVREPVPYQSPNSYWTARIPASQVQTALSNMGLNVGRVREVRVTEVDAAGRSRTLTFVGSGGSASAKSSNFRTHVGTNLLRSTFLTGGAPMASPLSQTSPLQQASPVSAAQAPESEWTFDISGLIPNTGNTSPQPSSPPAPPSPPAQPVPTSSTPMTIAEETRLTNMTSDGIFTAAELMDMLMNPDKRKGYLYIGMQRNAPPQPRTTPPPQVALPGTTPDAPMPPLRPAEIIPEENGYFVFHGRGWGHGVGLSQWGAMAMAREGWTAERILEYYYPGTAVKLFQ